MNQIKLERRPFINSYQDVCKSLILSGLEEHWGVLDLTLNKDLDNIKENYSNGIFLTGWVNNKLVATVAAHILKNNMAEIVRLSVLKEYRSRGGGKEILNSLLNELKTKKIECVVLETSTCWTNVINFYLHNGFSITNKNKEDTYFEKSLI